MSGTPPNIPLGIGPPNYIGLTIQAGDSNLDLTTVTALNLEVTVAQDQTTYTWACIILTQTPDELTALYPFSAYTAPSMGDVYAEGTYYVAPVMTVPGGFVPSYSFSFYGSPPGQTSFRNP